MQLCPARHLHTTSVAGLQSGRTEKLNRRRNSLRKLISPRTTIILRVLADIMETFALLPNALWGWTPGNLGSEGAQICPWHLTAHPSPPKELAVHLHAHPARTQQLRPPGHRQPHRGAGATTENRTKENSSRKAEKALQMRRKLMTNKRQKCF